MNRRGFIKRSLAAFGGAVIGGATAVEAAQKQSKAMREAEDKYWDAQAHINALEAERGNRPLTPEQFSKEAFGSAQRHFRKTGL